MKNKEEKVIFLDARNTEDMQKEIDTIVNPLISNDGWTIKNISSAECTSTYGHYIHAFFILERKRHLKTNE